jgi:hypothetical protein
MCCPVNEAAPDFIDEFVPGASNQTLLLLHGTVSNERDLIPLGKRAGPFIGAHLGRSANKRSFRYLRPRHVLNFCASRVQVLRCIISKLATNSKN